MRIRFILALAIVISQTVQGQDEIIWRNPIYTDFQVVEGQAWPKETMEPFDRLPSMAKDSVREAVWNLSKHSAGLKIRFNSNAKQISIRYQVSGNLAMNHMPATGVSGLDLYAKDDQGNWMWCRGQRAFADTIIYTFDGLKGNSVAYHLYLPLYNQVKWLEVGVSRSSNFQFLPRRKEPPIVIYGTSIAQGACASRPGLAWTNILERKLGVPIINLAFSGNGRLEPELIALIREIDARLFVLDCLPNLTSKEKYPKEELENRIKDTVFKLIDKHPDTPILLTDHAGYTDGEAQPDRMSAFQRVNKIQLEVYKSAKADYNNIHHLPYDKIRLEIDDTVDGTHPNDLGMMRHANAYESALKAILHK